MPRSHIGGRSRNASASRVGIGALVMRGRPRRPGARRAAFVASVVFGIGLRFVGEPQDDDEAPERDGSEEAVEADRHGLR